MTVGTAPTGVARSNQFPILAPDLETPPGRAALQRLDKTSLEAIRWIEADWNRNRYTDDPNKEGIYLPNENLLHRFKEMHTFHRAIMEIKKPVR